MIRILVFIVIIVRHLEIAKLDTLQEQTCRRNKNITLACNFIPEFIPEGIVNVRLNLEITNATSLDSTTFKSSGWDKINLLELRAYSAYVKYNDLFLQDNCFTGLKGLKELELHVSCYLDIFPNTFNGLDGVYMLDMDGCSRFYMKKLISALRGPHKLPGLEKLVLSNFGSYRGGLSIDDIFVKVLQSKKLSYLDVSYSKLTVNATAVFKRLKFLRVINASYATLDASDGKHLTQNDLNDIKLADVSYAIFSKGVTFPPGSFAVSNISANFSDIVRESLKLFLTPETLNGSGLVPLKTSFWFEKCEVRLDQDPHISTKELIVRQNNLRRLDIKLICEHFYFYSFERIDLSDNGLQFLHPDILPCFPNLQKIDLSSNKLGKMTQESQFLFEKIFSRLKVLKSINLSRNELNIIPFQTFENNGEIEVIDLTNNKLEQVHFDLTGLKKLQILYLRGNNIHNLDQISIDNLNSILNGDVRSVPNTIVNLESNPLSCSNCETKAFLTWILSTNHVKVYSQTLMCSDENGLVKHINENRLDEVKQICSRKTIIVVTSVSTGVVVLILGVALFIYYIQGKRRSEAQKRAKVINLLRRGEGSYQFMAFLAFSNDDGDFVNTYILHDLNENLQLMTGIDRELVCTGDRHFRPGFYVHNEAYRQLDTASIVIVVVSNNFCRSGNCRNELDQAYVKQKPIVLMLTEHIDHESMTPTMKQLYQRNVRILWTFEDGEYKMKTSWENVCTSILDLIQQ